MGEVDISVFGLDEQCKFFDEWYFIFYNQISSLEGVICLDFNQQIFILDLEWMLLGIYCLLLVVISDDQIFVDLGSGISWVMDGQGGEVVFEFMLGMFSIEQVVMLLELYCYQGVWWVVGVVQGFSGGLVVLL